MPHSAQDPTNLGDAIRAALDSAEPDRQLRATLKSIRPEDIARVLDDLDSDQKLRVFDNIETETQAEVIDETDPTSREQVLEHLDVTDLKLIIEEMPPDEATDLLNELPQAQCREVLSGLDPATTVELLRLMQHPDDSAGGIMTLDYIAVNPPLTSEEAISLIQKHIEAEVFNYVYAIDDQRHLIGVISIRDLLGSDPNTQVSELMETEVISIAVDEDQEAVAHLARRYNLQAIPVVDHHDHLLGVATFDDIVEILSDEADEDIYRLAGAPKVHPAQQKVLRRALLRIPWLLLPVISGFILAWMHPDERSLAEILSSGSDQRLLLAAFIPLVMGIAGGVGTQSATMVVRGMAVGDIELGRTTLRLFRQEVVVGIFIALAIGGVVGLVLALATGSEGSTDWFHFPLAVALGIGAGIILANACGTALPIFCEKIGLDPALVAGPFITSFNDVTAAIIFIAVAELILRTL
ncbi:MAG: magnesium transporter [Planctomycetota bacterium]|nr:magnesium transporter [Planctomycetota bacterium]